MESHFWKLFSAATAIKLMLIPARHSTDFEVHRNWLAITHTLPLKRWYYESTSEWTLDYPPFFAYFEWLLSQVARFVDPQMLQLNNLNYASERTIYFQRCSVMVTDVVYAYGAWRCLRALNIPKKSQHHFAAELLLLLNIGLLFVDHIHFQYNGFLFGILLLSISFLLEERFLLSAFTFSVLLNFKHIFLYMVPVFAVYYLKFYCLEAKCNPVSCLAKLALVGLTPFVVSYGPFWRHLPQVFQRLFPFKRGLTHAYWAPNYWAIYNTVDKAAAKLLRISSETGASTSSGLVQEFKHVALPSVSPRITFLLTLAFMVPILVKLLVFTPKKDSKLTFLRSVVLCACVSFMFGWHVHEKAILMCLIPLCLLCLLDVTDAKYAFWLSAVGYYSLLPLLFHVELLLLRYSFYLGYMAAMYGQLVRIHASTPNLHLNLLEDLYLFGFGLLPVYEHILSPLLGWHIKLPFMSLLLTSLYCSLGVTYFFIRYYLHTLGFSLSFKPKTNVTTTKFKSKINAKDKSKARTNAKLKPKSKQKVQ